MPRIIAISTSKGGVGKTTTAANLGAALAALGRRVLLIDTDTQGQAAAALGIRPPAGLADLILERPGKEKAITEARPGLELLAGGPDLGAVKREIDRANIRPEETLSRATAPLLPRFDYVLIDTAPGFDALTINVLFMAREILAPVNLEGLAVSGLGAFVEQVADIQAYQPRPVELRYILPTAYDRRTKQSGEFLEQLRAYFAGLVLQPIRYDVRLSEAAGHGKTIFEYAPGGRGARDYAKLTQRILEDE